MASNPCFAAFAPMEEMPILHYYGVEVFTMAKRVLISTLLLKGNKVDVEEFLKDTFPLKQQIILTRRQFFFAERYFLSGIGSSLHF